MAKQKAKYVDGFVLVVPKRNLNKYKKMAKDAAKVWKRFGCLDYKECVGDDMAVKDVISFTKLAKSKKNEVVFFSYITYKSRKHRDSVNTKVMNYFNEKYPDMSHKDAPFDMKRFAYSGFKVLVD